MDKRTCCPWPDRSLSSNAAVIACAAITPVNLSGTIVLTRRGRSSSDPAWMVVNPDRACTNGS